MGTCQGDPLAITGIRRLAAEMDSSVGRTRTFLIQNGCQIIMFAGGECVRISEVRSLISRISRSQRSRPTTAGATLNREDKP